MHNIHPFIAISNYDIFYHILKSQAKQIINLNFDSQSKL